MGEERIQILEKRVRLGAVILSGTAFVLWMILERKSLLNLLNVIIMAVLLSISYTMNIGDTAICAFVLGIIMVIFTGRTGYVCIMGTTSLTASIFWPLGRMMSAAAFLFGALGLGAVYDPELLYDLIPSLLAGTLLFLLIPDRWLKYIRDTRGKGRENSFLKQEEMIDRRKKEMRNISFEQARKWQDLSEAFSDISLLREFFSQGANAIKAFDIEKKENRAVTLRIEQGISRTVGSSDYISGDNYSIEALEDNRMLVMLSDGMGSGLQAYHDSDKAISRMEQLMEAGFSVKASLWLLHQYLLCSGREDVGTTVDALSVNLENGECVLEKAGAAASYLLRKIKDDEDNGSSWHVDVMDPESMPLGIFDELHTGEMSFFLKPGDIFVMMTDGVLDGLSGEMKEERMKGFLEFEAPKLSGTDSKRLAQALAGAVMDFAMTDGSRNENRDDMTVLTVVAVSANGHTSL